jgi:hypothetical protein
MSPAAKAKRRALLNLNNMSEYKDGDVNKYTGAVFNRADQLKFMQDQADLPYSNAPQSTLFGTLLTPEQAAENTTQRDSLYSQVYQPSKSKNSFLGKYGASLALAGLTGGIGLGAGALAGPIAAGSLAPTTVASGLKGLATLATAGR